VLLSQEPPDEVRPAARLAIRISNVSPGTITEFEDGGALRLAHRKRSKRGMHRVSITLTDTQLDALEVRGYLDPDRRGDRADECDAIEMFLGDSLNRR
jgi:hypothetical protein